MASAPPPAQETHEPGGAEGVQAENCHTTAECLREDRSRERMVDDDVLII